MVSDAGVMLLARFLPFGMETLHMFFSSCKQLTDASVLALADQLPATVLELTLGFYDCALLTDTLAIALAQRLPTSIEELTHDLDGCPLLIDAAVAAVAAGLTPTLEQLGFCADSALLTDVGFHKLARVLPSTVKVLRVWHKRPPSSVGNFNAVTELRTWAGEQMPQQSNVEVTPPTEVQTTQTLEVRLPQPQTESRACTIFKEVVKTLHKH